jgi:hypothetical protein
LLLSPSSKTSGALPIKRTQFLFSFFSYSVCMRVIFVGKKEKNKVLCLKSIHRVDELAARCRYRPPCAGRNPPTVSVW